MNAPNRFELFIVPDNEPKWVLHLVLHSTQLWHTPRVSVVDDSRIPSTSTITLNRQDHTIANLLSNEITKNKDVIFSGYRVPHPLNPRSEVRVQTVPNSITPKEALKGAATTLLAECANFQDDIKAEFNKISIEGINNGDDDFGMHGATSTDQPDEYYVDY